jgi:spore coat protein U-like protein
MAAATERIWCALTLLQDKKAIDAVVGELGLNVGELMQQTAQNLSFGLAFLQEASVSASGGIHFRDTFNTPERTPFDAGYKYTSLDALKQKTRILIVSYAGFWIVCR